MYLIEILPSGEFRLTENLQDDAIPQYAILSHTWGEESEEVTFEDMIKGVGRHKAGFKKIKFGGEQTARDGLRYFWLDSCCINKEIYAQLQEAISSMFRWYQRSMKCYVYLSDVSDKKTWTTWEQEFRQSRWFTRGWTLQELLAPTSVEFFSTEGRRLGDKISLLPQIHEITGIPETALQGEPLSRFSVNDRMRWIEPRQTKHDEDLAYSLLGIFGVNIPLLYGEGRVAAFERLQKEIEKLEECCRDLRLIDPSYHKQEIEHNRGGLLEDSYRWILEQSDFQTWRNNEQSHLLWIKGDPGKGKTMLLCGIINELSKSIAKTALLSFFFCVATNSRINNATAVLRGLIYMLVCQQPSLVSHIRKKYDYAGKALFDDSNAWFALSDMFTNILQDQNLNSTYLIIDALDECAAVDLPKLLDFIVKRSSVSSRVKWIVSSRNWPSIENDLDAAMQKVRLSLELNEESLSAAVATYIQCKVDSLAKRNKYGNNTRDAVQRYLSLNANGTFLWVALVCQSLSNIPGWRAQQMLTAFPSGLDALYKRMMDQIRDSTDAELCKRILGFVSAVYRPITLDELVSFVDMLDGFSGGYEALSEIIGLCGSFLTLREHTITFVHQSAKDFLVDKAYSEIYPSGIECVHHTIFLRSLQVISKKLRRDIYGLGAPGYSINQVKQPDPDQLSPARYSCVYWISHLLDCDPTSNATNDLQDGGIIDEFLRRRYLYWLEALSLCRSMSEGVILMAKLEDLLQARAGACGLLELVRDARRFIMSHKQPIQIGPLQAYASALIFSPAGSLIRRLFEKEEPKWISIKPNVSDKWSPCLQTLEGHSDRVSWVAFSHDSTRLASTSNDCTVKIWDADSGECLRTLEGYSGNVWSVAFSHDSTRLASTSSDYTIKIWDADSSECLRTLEGHSCSVRSIAFSHDSTRLASTSIDCTVKIWDADSGECLRTLEGYSGKFWSVAFSHDSTRLASTSSDYTIKIWDTDSGECLRTLKDHNDDGSVRSVVFSHDLTRLAWTLSDYTIKIWDAVNGECLQTLKGHSYDVNSIAFSYDLTRLASASNDYTVKIWDADNGECLRTLEGHSGSVNSVAFSHDSTWIASASDDNTIKIWDTGSAECLQTREGHSGNVWSVAFSHDSTRLASASDDYTIKIWDTGSCECLRTLEGHSSCVNSVAFSHYSTWIASASDDRTVKIWDVGSGECLQTLDAGKMLYDISFDTTGLYLHTEIGILAITALPSSHTSPNKLESQNPRHRGVGLSPNGEWITWNSQNLVWLPSEYRPSCSAISGSMIGIGVTSGKVWICNLQDTDFGHR